MVHPTSICTSVNRLILCIATTFNLTASFLFTQERVLVEGEVVDAESGMPIPDVNLTVRGTPIGTASDSLGRFSLSVPPTRPVVVAFTHIGYRKVVRKVSTDRPAHLPWRIPMEARSIPLREMVVVSASPNGAQRAVHTVGEAEFERLGEADMERAMRHFLPSIVHPPEVRKRDPSKDFTLYVDSEWRQSASLADIDPFAVRRVIVWDGRWPPSTLPPRRGRYVISVVTN